MIFETAMDPPPRLNIDEQCYQASVLPCDIIPRSIWKAVEANRDKLADIS
jgi:hypothetical protein